MIRSSLRGICAGGCGLMAVSSLAWGIAAVRLGHAGTGSIWISGPAMAAWHFLLATLFGVSAWGVLRGFGSARGRDVLRVALAAGTTLALRDVWGFYFLLDSGAIRSAFPVPLSLFVAALSIWTAMTVRARRDGHRRIPVALGMGLGAGGLVLLHLFTFGGTDYARRADCAIILGARVYRDGTPSLALSDRVRRGVVLYKEGRVDRLMMTGATGREGHNEGAVMRTMAIRAGVPADRILVDPDGYNTLASAVNCARLLRRHRIDSALVVSHDYHLPRCKLLFAERGIRAYTVPARETRPLFKGPYFTARECVAYLMYALTSPVRGPHSGS